jgi:hypothetical protein
LQDHGSPATVEPTADQTGGVQISEDGSLATVKSTVDQTGGVQISDGSPATLDFHRRSERHQFNQQ